MGAHTRGQYGGLKSGQPERSLDYKAKTAKIKGLFVGEAHKQPFYFFLQFHRYGWYNSVALEN